MSNALGSKSVQILTLVLAVAVMTSVPLPWIGVELPFKLQWLDTTNQDIWQNLALTSIGGLLSSTVLILLVLPALYYASVRVGWGLRQAWLWLLSLVPTAARRADSA